VSLNLPNRLGRSRKSPRTEIFCQSIWCWKTCWFQR